MPSTVRSATLGGLYGGGFGGVGSINYGPLASTGNVLGVRAMSIEPEPRTVELRGPEALLLHHVYGTAGLVLELEVGLAPAHPWLEAIVCFDSFDAAIEFGDALAGAPGLVKKSVTLLASPIPDLLLQAVPVLAGTMTPGAHTVFVLVAEFSEPGFLQLVLDFGGTVTLRKIAAEVKASNRTIVEYTWNHTTLHALKVDPAITYLQLRFPPGRNLELLDWAEEKFREDVIFHIEFQRRQGRVYHSSLPLVRFSTAERLHEIMRLAEEAGIQASNPHTWVLNNAGWKRTDAPQPEFKRLADPFGLMNPGKLLGWEADARAAAE